MFYSERAKVVSPRALQVSRQRAGMLSGQGCQRRGSMCNTTGLKDLSCSTPTFHEPRNGFQNSEPSESLLRKLSEAPALILPWVGQDLTTPGPRGVMGTKRTSINLPHQSQIHQGSPPGSELSLQLVFPSPFLILINPKDKLQKCVISH